MRNMIRFEKLVNNVSYKIIFAIVGGMLYIVDIRYSILMFKFIVFVIQIELCCVLKSDSE